MAVIKIPDNATNGDVIRAMFPKTIFIQEKRENKLNALMISDEWWNAPYKEPTTKNDLGVREFEEIVVEYPPEDICTYPEYKGKPYFSIKYKEGNDFIIGYGTYNPKVFSRYLRDYFMPSVTPQEPVLDKIREQIKSHLRGVEIALDVLVANDPLRPKMEGAKDTLEECLEVINRAEREAENENDD